MPSSDRDIFEFEGFRLDTAEQLMHYRDEPGRIALQGKAFEILCVLLRNEGRLIKKDELLAEVWKGSFVEENNINKCIYAVRRALAEKEPCVEFIETVKGHGFRFKAQVKRIRMDRTVGVGQPRNEPRSFVPSRTRRDLPAEAVAIRNPPFSIAELSKREPNPDGTKRKPLAKGSNRAVYILTLIALIGAAPFGYYLYPVRTPKVGDQRTIAVLPVQPIDSTNRDSIYEIGIAHSLINKMSTMNGFAVRPLSSVRRYADIGQDAAAAGLELRVEYVLTATYQITGSKIRVTAQLLNISTGRIEETYKGSERDVSNVFIMEDAIAEELARKISSRFGLAPTNTLVIGGTTNEEAYRLYLLGMYLYDKRTLPDSLEAVRLLERATSLDPNYARAWAAKAHAHRSLGNFGGSFGPHQQYKESIEAINKALALDDSLADAHSALCENKFFYEYDYVGAEIECKRAIELDAKSPIAHEIYSRYLLVRERFDESIAEIKTAIDLEPTSLFSQRNLGISLYYARRYPEAIAQFKRVVEMDPNFSAIYHWLINALHSQGNHAEAFEWFVRSMNVKKTDETTIQNYKRIFQKQGWKGVGEEQIRRFDESKIRSYFLEASLIAHTGNEDKAFEYLEKSYERREWGIPYLRIDPSLDSLRSDPRYYDLARRVALIEN